MFEPGGLQQPVRRRHDIRQSSHAVLFAKQDKVAVGRRRFDPGSAGALESAILQLQAIAVGRPVEVDVEFDFEVFFAPGRAAQADHNCQKEGSRPASVRLSGGDPV